MSAGRSVGQVSLAAMRLLQPRVASIQCMGQWECKLGASVQAMFAQAMQPPGGLRTQAPAQSAAVYGAGQGGMRVSFAEVSSSGESMFQLGTPPRGWGCCSVWRRAMFAYSLYADSPVGEGWGTRSYGAGAQWPLGIGLRLDPGVMSAQTLLGEGVTLGSLSARWQQGLAYGAGATKQSSEALALHLNGQSRSCDDERFFVPSSVPLDASRRAGLPAALVFFGARGAWWHEGTGRAGHCVGLGAHVGCHACQRTRRRASRQTARNL